LDTPQTTKLLYTAVLGTIIVLGTHSTPHLSASSRAASRNLLPAQRRSPSPAAAACCRLCYKFRNGPWKNAWTRRGYDPRTDPSARQWQCIEYHLPSEW